MGSGAITTEAFLPYHLLLFLRHNLLERNKTLIGKDIYENLNQNINPIIAKAKELFSSSYHVNAISAREGCQDYWKVSYTIGKDPNLSWKQDYIILRRDRECIEKFMQKAAIVEEAVDLVIFDKHPESLDEVILSLKPRKWVRFFDEFSLYNFLHRYFKLQPRVYKVIL